MTFTFEITVEVSHQHGKFASREELAEKIKDEIEGADPGTIEGDNEGEYAVDSFDVAEVPLVKPVKVKPWKPIPIDLS